MPIQSIYMPGWAVLSGAGGSNDSWVQKGKNTDPVPRGQVRPPVAGWGGDAKAKPPKRCN